MTALDRTLQRWRLSKARPWLKPGISVLDVGAGDGILFRTYPDLSGVALDPDLDEKEDVGVRFVRGFFPDAVPSDRQFDAVVMLAVVEHLPVNRLNVLARDLATLLNPGGRVIITVPEPAVDRLLNFLGRFRLIDGMHLEQHHGFAPARLPSLFTPGSFELEHHGRFQLGLNNLFVFRKRLDEQASRCDDNRGCVNPVS